MTQQALLVMDVQKGIVDRFDDGGATDYLARIRTALEHAHETGVPVIYVVIGFRDGHPEVSPHNKTFSALATGTTSRTSDSSITNPTTAALLSVVSPIPIITP